MKRKNKLPERAAAPHAPPVLTVSNNHKRIALNCVLCNHIKQSRMLIKEKLGNLTNYETAGRAIDRLKIEWHEMHKRVLQKKTNAGREVVIQLFRDAYPLLHDDVVLTAENFLVVISNKQARKAGSRQAFL